MLMAQHGGVFENYYHRGTVTHIICSNLTDQKVKLFLKERYRCLLAACCQVILSLWLTCSDAGLQCRLSGQNG